MIRRKTQKRNERPAWRTDPRARRVVMPGVPLGAVTRTVIGGEGTYVRNGIIRAAMLGSVTAMDTGNIDEDSRLKIAKICVLNKARPAVVPTTGDVVTAKVTQIGQRFAKCAIVAVGKIPLSDNYYGNLRKEDVRAVKKDSVVLSQALRCGDVIAARVLAMGDSSAYVLSTAEEELGVILAQGPGGTSMVPLTWSEMQCPITGKREPRKVAKVVPVDFSPPEDSVDRAVASS